MLDIAEAALFHEDLVGKYNLFVGAGFSRLASNSDNQTLPDGATLRDMLIAEFSLHKYSALDLQSIYSLIRSTSREAVHAFIKRVLTVSSYDSAYDILREMRPSSIYTTNIDDLFYKIFSPRTGQITPLLHDRIIHSAPRDPNSVVNYIPLHGCVRHDQGEFVFTPGQISSAFAADRETWYVFQRELQTLPIVFAGYSVKDAGVLQALHSAPGGSVNRWIVVRERDDATKAVFESLGLKIAYGDTAAFLAHLNAMRTATPYELSDERAPPRYGYIPSFNEVAQRPISQFFLGAEPEWSDAYSPQIVKRRIFSRAKNSLLEGKSIALVGLPLSGKSTILKQLAADLNQSHRSLYFIRLSTDMANEIIAENAQISGKTIVFVDNLIDSRDGIQRLTRAGKFLFAATEASYFFNTLNFKTNVGPLDVISCSDIDASDRQQILDTVPASLRRNHNRINFNSALSDGEEVGLFESLVRHVLDENLRARFRARLLDFSKKDPVAFGLYMMACYVERCRTLVSFDTMYMFLDNPRKQYADVYDAVARINDFLIEQDLVDDPHQDYFSVRSAALARIAFYETPDTLFANMFERFHKAIPFNVIPEYPIFRRYAYDNDFAVRAFPRAEEGKSFYQRLIRSTENQFDYAQGAVYLSKKKSFKDAFTWIDRALSLSGGKVYSIRNSHARILFESNIDVARADRSNLTAKDGLIASMGVLEECIEKDPRRSYHIMRFGDQCLQLYDAYGDVLSTDYMKKGRTYLRDALEEASSPGSREIYNRPKYRRILSSIEKKIPN